MPPPKPDPDSLSHFFVRQLVALHVFWYRASGGRIGGRTLGAPVLLLSTVGRKSGRRRTLPLLYLETEGGYAVVASYGGSDRHPAWYRNLEANPEVEIQVGPRRMKAIASTLPSERRAEIWPRLVALYPDYDTYQGRTEREIPVVELTPAE